MCLILNALFFILSQISRKFIHTKYSMLACDKVQCSFMDTNQTDFGRMEKMFFLILSNATTTNIDMQNVMVS